MEKRKFFPEIEILRAIAVFMTMMAHFIPETSKLYVPYMWYGVQLFFTISGFLITYILFQAIYSDKNFKKSIIIKNFFIRRILRLFPIYYIFIVTFFLLRNIFSIYIWNNDYNFYFFTYLQNMYFFKIGSFNSSFSHLWSLGVEEQFYLFWPFLLIFVNKKFLPGIFAVLISISVFSMLIFAKSSNIGMLTTSNFNTLGIGAVIAYLYFFKTETKIFAKLLKYRYLILISSLSLLIFSLIYNFNSVYLSRFLESVFLFLTTGSIVFNCVIGWNKRTDFFFKNNFLQHIGKISYGIYLYHMLVPVILTLIIQKIPLFNFLSTTSTIINFAIYISITYLVSICSYYFIEIRFLKLKDKFKN